MNIVDSFSKEDRFGQIHQLIQAPNYQNYEYLGAHLTQVKNTEGVRFSVWAPHATKVAVMGEFNAWDKATCPLMRVDDSEYWAGFVPGAKAGQAYKYVINTPQGHTLLKADPYAFYAEKRPQNASIVADINNYAWHDADWLQKRKQLNVHNAPISIYELHLGSWQQSEDSPGFLNYRQIAERLIPYVKKLGFTHIEVMPIIEHPLDLSWGYQVLGYFAPTSRFGTPEDFMAFVDAIHQADLGIILDWVPAHFPKDDHGLNNFDGTQIYAYQDPKKAEHKEWGTLVFDYDNPKVVDFLVSSALFWIEKYHLDGLRVDAVASMIYLDYSREYSEWNPNRKGGKTNLEAIEFLKKLNHEIHTQYPGVMSIAEESTAYPDVSRPVADGGLGFTMKWNMGWMHDTLDFFAKDSGERNHHHDMTFSINYAFTENFVLPISHDEVVHGKKSLISKMPGSPKEKYANYCMYLAWMFAHPGKKLLFMGQEFAQYSEWDHAKQIDWHLLEVNTHKNALLLIESLNHLYSSHPALYELDFESDGFEWLHFENANPMILSCIRKSKDSREIILIILNMTNASALNYNIGLPYSGEWTEIFNSNANIYGGEACIGFDTYSTKDIPMHDQDYLLELDMTPLTCRYFRFRK